MNEEKLLMKIKRILRQPLHNGCTDENCDFNKQIAAIGTAVRLWEKGNDPTGGRKKVAAKR